LAIMGGRHLQDGRAVLRRPWVLTTAGVLLAATAVALTVHASSSRANSTADGPAPVDSSDSAAAPPTSSSAPAAPSTAPSSTASPAPSAPAASATVTAAVTGLTASMPAGSYSLAEVNLTTGATYSDGAGSGMDTGSIVKLDILETLLLQHQDLGTSMSADEIATATKMIENSDNDAAETLFEEVGGRDAIARINPRLGVSTNTVLGPTDYWGLTTTDGPDQIALLKNLVTTGPLTSAAQQFALGLMRNVESDQRWGVGVVADAGTDFANKNGWLAVDDDGDRWLVNSLGVLTVHGQPVLIAVLTQHNSSFDAGIALVEALARAVVPAVTTSS
jgi:hypothetical protein